MKEPGRFGRYGGSFLPETLVAPVNELEKAYAKAWQDPAFKKSYQSLLTTYVGRPTPLSFAKNLTEELGGAKIYLKREDLNHTGAHKINNSLGQALLAQRMGKKRLIAETGAGQHGVATATAAALLGLDCVVYMGEVDMARQALNVYRMELLGAEVKAVSSGSKTLKDAISEAMRDWVTNVHDSYYCLGSALGPHPYPTLVRNFQSVIGQEAKEQIMAVEGRSPDLLIACVGGGSNSLGLFYEFIEDKNVALLGVEAGGRGPKIGEHAARFASGSLGIFHGTHTYLLQDENGLIEDTHSVSAGLDYPAVGPELAHLNELGRAKFVAVTDDEAIAAFKTLCRTEGIIPALESSHAVAQVIKEAPKMSAKEIIVMNLSGRGDKDVASLKVEMETSR